MAATKKAQRAKRRRMLRDPATRLLDAVGRYVKSLGGEAIVAGPIGLIPDPRGRRHQLVISFMGQAPAHNWRIVLGFGALEPVNAQLVDARYKQLAATTHPDRGGDPTAMARLNAARDIALQELRP